MKFNVASWNIWIYGDKDSKGIANLVKTNKIEIIGVQESAIYFGKNKFDMTKRIADELKFGYVFFPFVGYAKSNKFLQGNAILSKFPILESKSYKLNPPSLKYDGTWATEQRLLIHSKLKVDKTVINFLTTHLQYSKEFKTTPLRVKEVENILSVIKTIKGPIILTGDFNAVPRSKEVRMISKFLKRIGGNKSTWTVKPFESSDGFKTDKLKYRLDNIFVSKEFNYKNFKIINSDISDHLPIMVELSL